MKSLKSSKASKAVTRYKIGTFAVRGIVLCTRLSVSVPPRLVVQKHRKPIRHRFRRETPEECEGKPRPGFERCAMFGSISLPHVKHGCVGLPRARIQFIKLTNQHHARADQNRASADLFGLKYKLEIARQPPLNLEQMGVAGPEILRGAPCIGWVSLFSS